MLFRQSFKWGLNKQIISFYNGLKLTAAVAPWVKALAPTSGMLGVWTPAAADLRHKQVLTSPLPNAWQKVWVHVSRVLGNDHYNGCRCGTIKNSHCSSAENRSKFTAFHHMSVKFSSGTINSKQTIKKKVHWTVGNYMKSHI